ncbi:ureidoglycolate lyase [Agrobacterium sp. 22094]|uniref:ureidoglycolate lyase n=1 Tax=Agrobacterium sp. 22094 TaxID=3453872 RepID=UPI000DDDD2E3
MKPIVATPLTAESFEFFGNVFDISSLKGSAFATGTFDATSEAKLPVLQIVTVETIAPELTIRQLETHPYSSQTFLALDQAASLIVVCKPGADGRPDVSTLQAFISAPHQIVTYRRNVLHHKLTPLKVPASFAMTMCHTGVGGDTVLHDLPEAITLDVNAAAR